MALSTAFSLLKFKQRHSSDILHPILIGMVDFSLKNAMLYNIVANKDYEDVMHL